MNFNKFCLTIVLIMYHFFSLFAQHNGKKLETLEVKSALDTALFFNWPEIEASPSPITSNDRKYICYFTKNAFKAKKAMVVQDLDGKSFFVFPSVSRAVFTRDSRNILFINAGDSLCILSLESGERKFHPGIGGIKVFMREGIEWAACVTKTNCKELILINVSTGLIERYANVINYLIGREGKMLILHTKDNCDSSIKIIKKIDLVTGSVKELWRSKGDVSILLSPSGQKLAILSSEKEEYGKGLFIVMLDSTRGSPKVMQYIDGNLNFDICALISFSKNDKRLFIHVKKKLQDLKQNGVGVNVWSYFDAKLQSQQLQEIHNEKRFLAVIDMNDFRGYHVLQYDCETIISERSDDYLIINYREGDQSEAYWNRLAKGKNFLVSVYGDRKKIPIRNGSLSTTDKYVVGFHEDGAYGSDLYVYDISSGSTANVTSRLPIPRYETENDVLEARFGRGLRYCGWLNDDSCLLVYDAFDIWLIDPKCIAIPKRLTFGREKSIQFRLVTEANSKRPVQSGVLLLKAFNKRTKESGFYSIDMARNSLPPKLLFLGDYVFHNIGESYFAPSNRDTLPNFVIREAVNESPNLYFTSDFRTFNSISNIWPERKMPWYTSELLEYKSLSGIKTQGVLYKPLTMEKGRKYPVIFHYYDKKSDEKNKFKKPADNDGHLDISWFVNNGYIVFVTDINYVAGKIGNSVYSTIAGAVKYLKKLSYVDSYHIGLQGHSFGGYETNYLMTHSKLFAAAVSSSAVSDLTRSFGDTWLDGGSRQGQIERGQYRLNTTPWEQPDVYVKNSPIYFVGDVTTPVLLVHNRNDGNVRFENGLSLFMALRRAGKRVWMLEYDNGRHGVYGEDEKDYVIRMTQFFDHYLKGELPPKWMTRGIAASKKGIDNGYEFDSEIKTPSEGLLKK